MNGYKFKNNCCIVVSFVPFVSSQQTEYNRVAQQNAKTIQMKLFLCITIFVVAVGVQTCEGSETDELSKLILSRRGGPPPAAGGQGPPSGGGQGPPPSGGGQGPPPPGGSPPGGGQAGGGPQGTPPPGSPPLSGTRPLGTPPIGTPPPPPKA